ncbi:MULTISPECIES: sensor histidine kinase [Streptomyces]|uniref:histidine kinase n=1 Tax=Streptomyces venezuelae TaxID=54571 RepID=A0A5P2BKJ1_STRVZ|nr:MULTISPECIES: sensor histidine kinase [Streptomyces]NEA05693.1 sensor histidine kinase [Streptomyces sp. SID10116]MYY83809.1 sensor histidine kinase [Streptomyces sp. SID335]MYZ14792.1 sensor histidine kinase [Streptomyces sp. SID337]NDZ87621.1 sensor histidine kinase [Streptomyces sp. SID10115]NEB49442.1 sensor histidine kinase [Streptomyces sp. SID339]
MSRPGFLLSAWPWRAAAYLLTGAVTGAVTLVVIVVVAAVCGALTLVLVGLPLLVVAALGGIPVAGTERRRLRLVGRAPAAGRHQVPTEPGLRPWLTTRLREPMTWRELGYALLFAVLLWPVDAVAIVVALFLPLSVVATPLLMATAGEGDEAKVLKQWTVTTWPAAYAVAVLGLLLLAPGAYVLGATAGARAALTRLLLSPPEGELGARVVELARSRARLVDAFEAERRRIERDLHDGAQQRLVALSMTLGLARLDAPPGPLADQLAKAHGEAGDALAELRELIQGIYPKVLTDYGLEAAVTDAADRCAVPVDVELRLPGRTPQAVESAAYFVVCEALANIEKHSGAERARISGGHRAGRLCLELHDDGRGGADPAAGSGLTGLADRVSVLDGRLALTSPPGGPTLLRVEFPCELTRAADRSA